jgi:hypothetical protein
VHKVLKGPHNTKAWEYSTVSAVMYRTEFSVGFQILYTIGRGYQQELGTWGGGGHAVEKPTGRLNNNRQ